MKSSFSVLALAGVAAAQVPVWGQCGGIGFSGSTVCVSGNTCVFVNDWYSQCQVGGGSVAVPTTTSTAPGTTPTGGSTGAFRFLGRVNPVTKELTWPGTGISFTFTGSSASIQLTSVTGTNSVDLIIDGGKPTVISNVAGTSISTPAGLSNGKHVVVLRKRSESLYGTIVIGGVTTDGTIGADVAPTRRIEIIGDSISVGYGLDGTNPCTNTAAVENNPKTYGALAAEQLGADYSVVAWSGKGLTRNIGNDDAIIMPILYTRYGANDADNSYTFPAASAPDAIVINLGTNDFNYLGSRDPINAATFTAGMVGFVKSIRTHYPNATYFLMTSPMLSDGYPTAADAQHTTLSNAVKAAITQLGGKVQLVDWLTQGSDVGCDYHPNAATNAAEAPVLAAAIKAALKW
jgi:lysophospholipase L1-like esterase